MSFKRGFTVSISLLYQYRKLAILKFSASDTDWIYFAPVAEHLTGIQKTQVWILAWSQLSFLSNTENHRNFEHHSSWVNPIHYTLDTKSLVPRPGPTWFPVAFKWWKSGWVPGKKARISTPQNCHCSSANPIELVATMVGWQGLRRGCGVCDQVTYLWIGVWRSETSHWSQRFRLLDESTCAPQCKPTIKRKKRKRGRNYIKVQ